MFSIADLPNQLIQGNYHIEHADITDLSLYYIGFALGSYKFKKYKSKTTVKSKIIFTTTIPVYISNYRS